MELEASGSQRIQKDDALLVVPAAGTSSCYKSCANLTLESEGVVVAEQANNASAIELGKVVTTVLLVVWVAEDDE